LFPTRLLTSEDECKWFWHQMIYFPGIINTMSTSHIIILHYNGFIANFPAMHVDLLCACWCLWAVKGSSSSSFCHLLISPRFTSCHLLCPKLTDAPYPGPGSCPPLPLPKWRLHSQGPHTLPSQGTTHVWCMCIDDCDDTKTSNRTVKMMFNYLDIGSGFFTLASLVLSFFDEYAIGPTLRFPFDPSFLPLL
jgi:hypothetical protein